jgi:uncharacterized protein with FMN-binding domain
MSRKALVALMGFAFCLALCGCKTSGKGSQIVITNVNIPSVMDGTYEGEQKGMPVSAKVQVTVKSGRLESVTVLKHTHGPGKGAEAIINRVIAAQSLTVDAVAGATSSSRVMLKAIETALEKGL